MFNHAVLATKMSLEFVGNQVAHPEGKILGLSVQTNGASTGKLKVLTFNAPSPTLTQELPAIPACTNPVPFAIGTALRLPW